MRWLIGFSIAFLCINENQSSRQIVFKNQCTHDIWVNPFSADQYPPLAEGIQRLRNGDSYTYRIPNFEWKGRFWPKLDCDVNGQNCRVGQSVNPCGRNGCDDPANTLVEFFYPAVGNPDTVWYDVSLVDGYSVPMEIIPSALDGPSCVRTRCAVHLNDCPSNEHFVGDLRVRKSGRTVQCLSPCKKWTSDKNNDMMEMESVYGFRAHLNRTQRSLGRGRSEREEPGLHLCCPTPPVTPEECNRGIVVQTQYVNLIHRDCPTAYSFAYDDKAGNHDCRNTVDFRVNIC